MTKAVGIGKLYGLALAGGGEAGVLRALELLEMEIGLGLGLLGVTRLDELNPSFIRPAMPVYRAHTLNNAFPFLDLPESRY